MWGPKAGKRKGITQAHAGGSGDLGAHTQQLNFQTGLLSTILDSAFPFTLKWGGGGEVSK